MNFSETNKEIAAAFAKAWGKMETPKHNRKVKVPTKSGGSYEFEYTDLGGIMDAARKPFSENNIAIMQNTWTSVNEQGKNEVHVQTTFLHESGEWAKTDVLSFQAAFGMQDVGGQITYMKRYSLSAALGLSTEKDDDGNPPNTMLTPNEPPKQNQNRQQNQNRNQNKQHGGYGSPDDKRQAPPSDAQNGQNAPFEEPKKDKAPEPPKMISEGQIKRIETILENIGKKEGKTSEEVFKLYQMKIKKDFDYKTLKMAKASSLIAVLYKIEQEPHTLYEA